METINEEKSLVKVDNGIFSKIRRFFHNIFSRRNELYYAEEISNDNTGKESEYKEDEYTQPKLFNYDDPRNYIGKENDDSLENVPNTGEVENIISDINENQEIDYNTSTNTADSVLKDTEQATEQNETQYIGISKYFDDVDENYIGKSKKQASKKREDGYEEKEELEQKLMNYYASIKKVIQ